MPDEHPGTLDKVYEARGDLYAIQRELEVVKTRLAHIPTRRDLSRAALGVIFCTTVLVLLGIVGVALEGSSSWWWAEVPYLTLK